jgi:hypothetical protein
MIPAQTAYWVVFTALILFQIKHFACDFALQTPRQIQAKGNYGHMGGMEHAGLHAISSLPALLVMTRAPLTIGLVMIAEFLVHYHVDFGKARIDRAWRLNDTTTAYWTVFGLDQLLHQLTYLVIVALLAPPL